MTSQIRITPDQMRVKAVQYREVAEKINSAMNRLEQLMIELQEEWNGSAGDHFFARYKNLKPSLIELERITYTLAEALDSTAQAYEKTEASIVSNLFD